MLRPIFAFRFLLFASSLAFLTCKNAEKSPVQTVEKPARPANYYGEKHRPQFHFSPPTSWMNDPNGMVFYAGEWHLFYQFFPDSTVWGPMHWGHAVSRDLVEWAHLPVALAPDSSLYVFSGSAAVDWQNSSGFQAGKEPPLVAMFTIHDMKKEAAKREDVESQGIAFSNDRGRTWTKFSGNPVIENPKRGRDRDFRDPKIVWHEPSKSWICALSVGDHAEFWGSKDLKKWAFLSEFGRDIGPKHLWECPDFAPVAIENSDEKKWMLIQNLNPGGPNGGSTAMTFCGDFDGKTFTLDPRAAAPGWLDWGRDNYASVSWADVPPADGRRVIIGWMSNWQYAQVVPTAEWRSAMTLPREVFLRKSADGKRLGVVSQPVRELEKLREKTVELAADPAFSSLDLMAKTGAKSPVLLELELDFELFEGEKPAPNSLRGGQFGAELLNEKGEVYRLGFDVSKNQFFSDRRRAGDSSFSKDFADKISVAPRSSDSKKVSLHVFFDAASAELFADGGEQAMTEIFFPSTAFSSASLFCEGGKARFLGGRAHVLRSIW